MEYLTQNDILEFQRELALLSEGFFTNSKDNISNINALEHLSDA